MGEEQREFMARVRAFNNGAPKTFYLLSMGCQMNAHDAEKLAGMLGEMGYRETKTEAEADLVLYNTCCVRENAEQKVYGKLGYLKHYKAQRPDMLIALCGCMTQQAVVLEKLRKSYPQVDLVFGTFNLGRLPELLYRRLTTGEPVYDVWDAYRDGTEDLESLPACRHFAYKASVNIMYGCDNFCTYCIVPYVRGRERSRTPEDIEAEVRRLVADGVVEVMLLGQNVNSYGKGLAEPADFPGLLRRLNQIEGLRRIRFMSSHPKDLSMDLIAAMAECDKVCPQLHLPVQAGSTRLLAQMNRRYTKEDYLEKIFAVRAAMPDLALSTDIMVGFPGETEEDFAETLDVVRQARFANAFTFIYSPRTGTRAAEMPDQIPAEVVKERFDRLLATVNPLVGELHEAQVGKTVEVLVEEVGKGGLLSGRAPNNMLVHFPGDERLIGSFVPVRITQSHGFYLTGACVEKESEKHSL